MKSPKYTTKTKITVIDEYIENYETEIFVNKKKVQRIMQKLGFQVTSFTRKSRKYSSYKGNVGKTP